MKVTTTTTTTLQGKLCCLFVTEPAVLSDINAKF